MSKSSFTEAHKIMVDTLIAARRESGLKQAELAKIIGKDQSYISNIERGERRVDILEFVTLARSLGLQPTTLFSKLVEQLPSEISI